MRQPRAIASATAGVLALLCVAPYARAQGAPPRVGHVAPVVSGSIAGLVEDDMGAPIEGAVVSAVGSTNSFAITDRRGRFELRALAPGPYLVRAHLGGFTAPQGSFVEVRPGARASSSIALRRAADGGPPALPVLAAGLGAGLANPAAPAERPDDALTAVTSGPAESDAEGSDTTDDHGEVAWKLRHLRRGVLKNATLIDGLMDGETGPAGGAFAQPGVFVRAAESSIRLASSFFTDTPFSGQLNLLTTGSFDAPQQLFSNDGVARSVAYLSLGAPAGRHADWTVRGALTQGDVSSWVVAGAYVTRPPARHRYDVGLSYSTQQYGSGSPTVIPPDRTAGSRSAGAVYAFDTFAVTPAVTVAYGARIARYDYLDGSTLVSPRLALGLSPGGRVRINAAVSRRVVAPGAEEFMPPSDGAIWLPPQRTFSSLVPDRKLVAERTAHAEIGVEHDVAGATLSLRAFHQQVADQIATMFGIDAPGVGATRLGHYLVANAGDLDTSGWTAGFRTSAGRRLRGSIEYSQARARGTAGGDLAYVILLSPPVVRLEPRRLRDVATTLETEVPETSTRVLVLYRVSNGFASATDRPALDSRFDVQLRQSLPFMDFSSAKWEMLLAVRNVFRETAQDSSIFDEMFVVRPPKRIVGGLALRF